MKLEYAIKEKEIGQTIHTLLKNELNISTRLLTKLIKNEKIYLNHKKCDTRNFLSIGDILEIYFDSQEDNTNILPIQMKLDILYEDQWILAIHKPAGIPTHPSRFHYTDSLSNGVKFYFDKIGLAKKIRPVNRLDLDTSGVILFAKCEYIQESFMKQMSDRSFQKEYVCITQGLFKQKSGSINLPIARKNGSIIERCVHKKNGKPCVTHYHVSKEFQNNSLVKCTLETGRTHQIRVHMASIGHPLLGDTLYGSKSEWICRQALHSYKIQCIHPISKKILTLRSPLPKDMVNALRNLSNSI